MKNPFYWHLDKKRGWCFGDYWITNFLGGLVGILGFICIISVPFIVVIIAFILGLLIGKAL